MLTKVKLNPVLDPLHVMTVVRDAEGGRGRSGEDVRLYVEKKLASDKRPEVFKQGALRPHVIIKFLQNEFNVRSTAIIKLTCLHEDAKFLTNGRGGIPEGMRTHFFEQIVSLFSTVAKHSETKKHWIIDYQTLFDTNYSSLDEFHYALLGVGKPISVRVPSNEHVTPPHYKYLSVTDDLERLIEAVNSSKEEIVLLKGETGAGIDIVLDKAFHHFSNSHSDFSTIKINLFEFRSIEDMLENMSDELSKMLDTELDLATEDRRATSAFNTTLRRLKSLLSKRKEWIFFVDATSSYMSSTEKAYYDLLTPLSLTDYVTNQMSLNQLINTNIRVVLTTQDISTELTGAIEVMCQGTISNSRLDHSLFNDGRVVFNPSNISPRGLHCFSVVENLVQLGWFNEDHSELKKVFNSVIDSDYFGQWFVDELRKKEGLQGLICLLISSLPDDDIRESSLASIMYKYSSSFDKTPMHKLYVPFSSEDIFSFINKWDNLLITRFNDYSQVSTESNPEWGEYNLFIKVQPFVRKILLDNVDPLLLERIYRVTGRFAWDKYEEHLRIPDKLTTRAKQGKLAQAIKFRIRGIQHTDLDRDREPSAASDEVKDTWQCLKQYIRALKNIDGENIVKLRYTLLYEFSLIEKKKQNIPLYTTTAPLLTANLVNLMGSEAAYFYQELLIAAQQLNKHNVALSILEILNSKLIPIDKDTRWNYDSHIAKLNEGYYFTANRTGRYSQASYFIDQLLIEREKTLKTALKAIPNTRVVKRPHNMPKLLEVFHSKMLSSLTKKLMVTLSIGDDKEVLEQMYRVANEYFDKKRMIVIDRVELFQHINNANIMLDNDAIINIYMQHLTQILKSHLDTPSLARILAEERSFIIEENGKPRIHNPESGTTIKVSTHSPSDSVLTSVELLRLISRYKSLIECKQITDLAFVASFNTFCELYGLSISNVYKRARKAIKLDEDPSQLELFYTYLGLSTNLCEQMLSRLRKVTSATYEHAEGADDRFNQVMTPSMNKMYHICRENLLATDWQKKLSVPWQADVLVELFRIETVLLHVKAQVGASISISDYTWMIEYCERLIEEAHEKSDYRTMSNTLTLLCTFYRICIDADLLADHELIQYDRTNARSASLMLHIDPERKYKQLWHRLYKVSLHSDYGHRKAEIATFKEGRNPLDDFVI